MLGLWDDVLRMLSHMGRLLGLALVCLFTVGATSCGADGSDPGQGPTFVTELVLKNADSDPSDDFERGEPITLELKVRNRTETDVIVQFGTTQTGDAIVVDAGTDRIRWQWSHDKAFPMMPTELTFDAGEAKTFKFTWDQRDNAGAFVPGGEYEARAVLLFEEFEIDPLVAHQLGSSLVPFEIH